MTDSEKDNFKILLWENQPEFIEIIDEFYKLASLAKVPAVSGILNLIADGLFKEAAEPSENGPFCVPCGIKSPTRIETTPVDDAPASVWFTDNMRYRLHFLRTGQLMVCYPNVQLIVPLKIRLDPDTFVNWPNE